jgi:arginine/ornithine N-succinyltransferase beta subunit
VREALTLHVVDREPEEGKPMLLAHGRLQDFVACYGTVEVDGPEAAIDADARRLLGVSAGDELLAVSR